MTCEWTKVLTLENLTTFINLQILTQHYTAVSKMRALSLLQQSVIRAREQSGSGAYIGAERAEIGVSWSGKTAEWNQQKGVAGAERRTGNAKVTVDASVLSVCYYSVFCMYTCICVGLRAYTQSVY